MDSFTGVLRCSGVVYDVFKGVIVALSIASSSSFSYKIAVDTDLEADAKVNIFGSGATVRSIDVDNAANGSQVVYLKLYDSGSTVTPGTSAPDYQFRIAGGARLMFVLPGGVSFAGGLTMNCSTTAGTSGDTTTDPTNGVIVNLVVS